MSDKGNKIKKLAILYNPDEKLSPSNKEAINRFELAGRECKFLVDVIRHYDLYRLFEYDALFIRVTTCIRNQTYWAAVAAERLGLAVMDDPHSIRIGSDKVTQHELFIKNNIPIPKTFVANRLNTNAIKEVLQPPYVFKNPFGSFSNGVYKVNTFPAYDSFCITMLEKLDDFIIQEFIETEFDWRIGILNNEILFACKYYMTKGHWKVIKHNRSGDFVDGESVSVRVGEIPVKVAYAALKVAALVGSGLYGVDIKEANGQIYVIEINDNPNIDAGTEDTILGFELYEKIILHFHRLLEQWPSRELDCELALSRAIPNAFQSESK